jgi:hypothetical protein
MTSSSETASFSSEPHVEDDFLSLFSQLEQCACKNGAETVETDEFKTIQKSISRLPKITSKFEANLKEEASKTGKKTDILRANDPIVVKKAKNPGENTDAGDKWFNMKQQELTDEVKRDLLIIKQRSALDPKRHYKKQKWDIPKYFQMGTIIEGNTEFYSRLNRRQRGNNLVQEILHDDESKKYFKRKYSEIQLSKMSGRKGHYKKVKEMRKKF